MNRYDIALGKKPPEAPLVQAMRKALDEPYTPLTLFGRQGPAGVSWPPTGEGYANYYTRPESAYEIWKRTRDLTSQRIPATGDH